MCKRQRGGVGLLSFVGCDIIFPNSLPAILSMIICLYADICLYMCSCVSVNADKIGEM